MPRIDHEIETDRGPKQSENVIPLAPGKAVELLVHNPNGSVTVRATDRADILIRATKWGRPGSHRYENAHLVVEADNNRVEVRTDLPPGPGHDLDDLRRDLGDVGRELGEMGREIEREVRRAFGRKRGRGLFGGRVDEEPGTEATASASGVSVGVFGVSGSVRYDLEIEIPRATGDRPAASVDVRTASGEATIEGVGGQVHLTTASGDARLRAVEGEIAVQSASGDLAIDRIRGGASVRTASGDVSIHRADLDRCVVATASGDLNLDTVLAGVGPYRFESVSGDVQLDLGLPSGTGATLTFKTVSGDASMDAAATKTGRGTWRLGPDGGPEFAVKTVSGDLQVRAREVAGRMEEPTAIARPTPSSDPVSPVSPVPPVPPVPPIPAIPPVPPVARVVPAAASESAPAATEPAGSAPAKADRLEVLQALERGEIDVDEALSWLESDPEIESGSEPGGPPVP